jgi:8-oxo-dGTP diphosphatase
MPPADRPVVAALLQPDRYLVTPPPGDDDASWLARLRSALDAGIRRVQLRSAHDVDLSRWQRLVRAAVDACHAAGVDVLINGDIALAQALGIGVHLRAVQLRSLDARPLPTGCLVGASCHDAEALQHAERMGCDFAVLGAVAPTATHPGAAPLGWAGFAALRELTSLPLYAIGGMTADDITTSRAHGAQGIAAIRALWPASID